MDIEIANTRASRITVAGGIILQPAEMVARDSGGYDMRPVRTLVTEKQFAAMARCQSTRLLFAHGVLELSDSAAQEWMDELAQERPAVALEESEAGALAEIAEAEERSAKAAAIKASAEAAKIEAEAELAKQEAEAAVKAKQETVKQEAAKPKGK